MVGFIEDYKRIPEIDILIKDEEIWKEDNDKEMLEHIELTLDKMAFGGIYDQIGGGFSR